MDREEQMKAHWEKLLAFYKLDKEKYYYNWRGGTFQWSFMHPGTSPLMLHFTMFQTAVQKLSSEEQKAKWMPQIYKMRMVGCYA